MFFSTLFTLFGLGALCWIMFNLAVYALPFAIGLTSGMYLYECGQGVFLSIIAEFGSASAATITLLSWLGALVVGGTAWARVSGWSEVNAMSDPHPHRSFDEH